MPEIEIKLKPQPFMPRRTGQSQRPFTEDAVRTTPKSVEKYRAYQEYPGLNQRV
jgi:hypothetical protein